MAYGLAALLDRQVVEDIGSPLHHVHPEIGRVQARLPRPLGEHLSQRAHDLDASGPTADDGETELLPARLRLDLASGGLELCVDRLLQLTRVVHRPHRDGAFLQAGDGWHGCDRTGCDDEPPIRHLLTVAHPHHATDRVDRRDAVIADRYREVAEDGRMPQLAEVRLRVRAYRDQVELGERLLTGVRFDHQDLDVVGVSQPAREFYGGCRTGVPAAGDQDAPSPGLYVAR